MLNKNGTISSTNWQIQHYFETLSAQTLKIRTSFNHYSYFECWKRLLNCVRSTIFQFEVNTDHDCKSRRHFGAGLAYCAKRACTLLSIYYLMVISCNTWCCNLSCCRLGLKRLSIFAYRLTVNTNDRFIGLTIIDFTVIRDTGPVAFANSKQRLSTIIISCHSWTSLHPVLWSEAGWLSHLSASRSLPSASMLAASSRVTVVTFRNSSRRPVDSSNLFATHRETAAKFSAVHLPLKQRVSRTLLHSALSRSMLKVSSVRRNDWVAHELCCCWSWPIVSERQSALTNSCLRSQETVHFLLGTFMSVSKERG